VGGERGGGQVKESFEGNLGVFTNGNSSKQETQTSELGVTPPPPNMKPLNDVRR
jgi:hypothetical protein